MTIDASLKETADNTDRVDEVFRLGALSSPEPSNVTITHEEFSPLLITRARKKVRPPTRQNKPVPPKEEKVSTDPEEETKSPFKTCGEAIEAGLRLFQQGEYDEALDAFADSLDLPGEGRFRLEGRAKEFSGPSKSQEDAALYNMMCCHVKLGEFDSALTCLEALLESGFENYDTLRNDTDLQAFRKADSRFEETIKKFDSMQAKMMKAFRDRTQGPAKKPWLI